MKTLFKILGAPFANLPFCSLPGAVVGSFAGFLFSLLELENPTMSLAPQQLAVIALLVGVIGWLLVLFFFGLLLRYGVGQILWPALLNALLTALLTVVAAYWIHMPAIAGVIGLLIGILVGAILCWLCLTGQRGAYGKT